jgi:hypothetical protein
MWTGITTGICAKEVEYEGAWCCVPTWRDGRGEGWCCRYVYQDWTFHQGAKELMAGTIMTAADAGIKELSIVGPPDTSHFLATLRTAVQR